MNPVATIDHSALRHNLAVARSSAPDSRVMAVIKADGYGHGLLAVAEALSAADGFAVARCEEALALREGGVERPLLVLGGFANVDELRLLSRHRVDSTVHDDAQLQLLERTPLDTPLSVWLKIDSGMHRLGFPPQRIRELLGRLRQSPQVAANLCLMTHLANADDRADPYTGGQLDTFRRVASEFDGECSIANSAGVMGWPASRWHWSRPGIMLYGCSPFVDSAGPELGLRPVMTLTTRLIATHWVEPGEPVGYGGTWRSTERRRIGVAAIGYGDGYPRHVPSGTPLLVDGRRAPLAGRVSMDTLCLDITGLAGVGAGSRVVAWGEGLPVEEIARAAATIAYELLCRVTPRVRRVGLDHVGG